jgi:hypothetical protein
MDQTVPHDKDRNVERIAICDFGPAHLAQVINILQEYGKQDWNRPGSPCVRLAILKLANGDLGHQAIHKKAAIQFL